MFYSFKKPNSFIISLWPFAWNKKLVCNSSRVFESTPFHSSAKCWNNAAFLSNPTHNPSLWLNNAGQPNRKVYGQKIQSWESEKGLAFLQNVELSDGELVVPQAGLYYIYSQTYFRHTLIEEDESDQEDGTSGESVRGKPMLQYIYKKVSSYPVPILLMKNARTTCWSRDTEYGLYSIYQAGLFQLGGGDRVFVTVSNISSIDMDEKSSFFGAFLVS